MDITGWYQVKSAPGYFGTYLHSQIGTSIKNNLVIIKYSYKNKNEKVGFNS
jgi:hypothetical protein